MYELSSCAATIYCAPYGYAAINRPPCSIDRRRVLAETLYTILVHLSGRQSDYRSHSVLPTYSLSFLYRLVVVGRCTLDTQVGWRDDETQIHTDLAAYTATGYGCMDNDTWRNVYFRRAIASYSNSGRPPPTLPGTVRAAAIVYPSVRTQDAFSRWLEIGPGASGTLSRMVLGASPETHLVAVEAVEASADTARQLLEEQYPGRSTVVHGLAGQVVPLVSDRQVLLAEILGHFGSSEGYVAILHACASRYDMSGIRAAVPRYFGTRVVPVDLSDTRMTVAAITTTLVLVDKFPFVTTQISGNHGTMELYDALHELRYPKVEVRVTTSYWEVETNRPFHGLGFYVCFGDTVACTSTSDVGQPMPCTAWSNVFLPVAKGAWEVRAGDTIKCECRCTVHTVQPSYEFIVSVLRRAGQTIVCSSRINLDYLDLMPRLSTVRSQRPP